jgi:hypothetical protein
MISIGYYGLAVEDERARDDEAYGLLARRSSLCMLNLLG